MGTIQTGAELDFAQTLKNAYRGDSPAFATNNYSSLVRHKFDGVRKTNTSSTVETYNYTLDGVDILTAASHEGTATVTSHDWSVVDLPAEHINSASVTSHDWSVPLAPGSHTGASAVVAHDWSVPLAPALHTGSAAVTSYDWSVPLAAAVHTGSAAVTSHDWSVPLAAAVHTGSAGVTSHDWSVPLAAASHTGSAGVTTKDWSVPLAAASHTNSTSVYSHDWSSVNETIVIGTNTATLNTNCNSISDIVTAITNAFAAASPSAITGMDVDSAPGDKIKISTTATGSGASFVLDGTALATLYMTAGTYTGTDDSSETIKIGSNTATLEANCTTSAQIVTAIETAFAAASPAAITGMTVSADGSDKITIATVATGSGASFVLDAASTALTTLNMTAATYTGTDSTAETLVIGANTATLVANAASATEIVAAITAAFAAASPAAITTVTASKDGSDQIVLTSTTSGASASFDLDAASTALTTLHLTAGTYTGTDSSAETIVIGANTATLTANCADAAAIVAELVTQFAAATPAAISTVTPTKDGSDQIVLTSTTSGSSATFTLDAGSTALTTLHLTAGTYTGTDASAETIKIGANTATLTASCADATAIVAELVTAFAAATPAAITTVTPSKDGSDKITLTSTTSGSGVSFVLDAASTALSTLHLTADTYTGTDDSSETIVIGSNTATLNANCADAAAVLAEIVTQFAAATPAAITDAVPTLSSGKLKLATPASGSGESFTLDAASTALTTLSLTSGTYTGTDDSSETIVIGSNTATLEGNCTTVGEIITAITTAFAAASPAAITDVVASLATGSKISLATVAVGSAASFVLDAASTALTTLNMTANTYTGSDGSYETLVIGSNTATLDSSCANIAAVVAEINAEFATATPSAITGVEAYAVDATHVGLRTTSSGAAYSFTLGAGSTALTTLGFTAGTYTGTDADTIVTTIVVTYTDSTKSDISTVLRTYEATLG